MTILLPILVAVIGILIWFVSQNPKVSEAGRIMFAFGLLAFLLTAGPQVLSLLR